MLLKDKTAIVTGGGRGIGRVICFTLARAGAHVVIGDIDLPAAEETAGDITTETGVKAIAVEANVTDKAALEAMMAACMAEFGRLDILVNNAGVFPIAPVAMMTEEVWDRVSDIDLKGVFLCCQAALGPMRASGGGRIINMASVSGIVGAIGFTAYGAAKAGVSGFTRSLAREVAAMNITVNAVAPGIVDNEMTYQTFPKAALDQYITQVPLRRLTAPEDVANLVQFLASDQAAYITGQTIAVDGGYTMR